MNLEDQVVSLELAKRLKELGANQESLFYWVKEDDPYIWYNSNNYPIKTEKLYNAAYTVSELGLFLPHGLNKDGEDYYLFIMKLDNWHICYTRENGDKEPLFWFKDDKEADARAKMLIHLLENNIIKVEDINK
jgi:hypothetical protein